MALFRTTVILPRALRSAVLALALAVALLLGAMPSLHAEDGGPPPDAGDEAAAQVPDAVLDLERETQDVHALIAGKLSPAADPQSLFDVSLDDEGAIGVDAARLRMLLRDVDETARRKKPDASLANGAPRDAGLTDASVDPALWKARIGLDRARLAFYGLPSDRRAALLAAHAQLEQDGQAPMSPAQLREREAEEQRQAALATARDAHTESERRVAAEVARLLEVERAQTAFDKDLDGQKAAIAERREVTLGWQKRAAGAREGSAESADQTYDDLRGALRAARDALSKALDELRSAPSAVPGPGADALADLFADVDTAAAHAERVRVVAEAARLEEREEGLRRERAAQLFDEIDTLNAERLGLLGSLSPAKREAVTGFTASGWDQAASEGRQLTLILRYHGYVISAWVLAFRNPRRALGAAVTGGGFQALQWVLALALFVWWRRRSAALLEGLKARAEAEDRRARLAGASPASRALRFLVQVHRPIEWLALVFVLRWILPASTQEVLEVRVMTVLLTWTLGSALVVDVINALAGGAGRESSRRGEPSSAALRLRSLRLIARVVVVFGLILVVSSMLVGRGTIYLWVFSTCWFASIPVALVLVRWWRNIVFRRIELVRNPTRIERWVLANSKGWWTSFAAAAIGGAFLFANSAARVARNWVGRFVITRRALAYLFRRQLDKREQTGVVGPIPDAAFGTLGPEHPSAKWIAHDADEAIAGLGERIRARKGGIVAIVGDRGMGKSTILHRLCGEECDDTLLLDALSTDGEALRKRFAESLGLPPSARFEEAASALAVSPKIHALLVDDAQRFVQPVVGGLATFDTLLAMASRHTRTTTWVFAFDQVIWQFLERSRGARPLFDDVILLEPWAEEHIVSLLQARTEEAGLTPSFESLLEPQPATADEVDKQEALVRTAADYYRLLWDAANGNPGVALHMWRRSLGVDAGGKTAVRPSTALDTSDLERLPDSSAFVLRAVLQLAPARAEQIAKGSSIRLGDVADALRYATSRGYIEERDGGYRVTWTWFRAITLFLQRKHLLVTR